MRKMYYNSELTIVLVYNVCRCGWMKLSAGEARFASESTDCLSGFRLEVGICNDPQ